MLSFDNTQCAFAYKSDSELKRANFLFTLIAKPWLVKLVLKIIPPALKWHIPLTNTLIRKTMLPQFVGGENLQETAKAVAKLERFDVKVILDYGVEGGKDGERGFDSATEEFIKVINYAARQSNIPFISVKVTGIAGHAILEKLDTIMNKASGTLLERYSLAITDLSEEEKQELNRIRERILRICENASEKNIAVLIDAEETWIQDPVDALTILMMDKFNKSQAVVFNTLQLYRHDRLQFLKDMFKKAEERDFILGSKLVRGAYMEKERERAAANNYPSPIHATKEDCDKDFNEAIKFCVDNINRISLIVASHNEDSN
jgi:proline dehydrogenase